MIEDIVIKPMTEDFILWRCLHGGPLSRDTIDQWSSDDKMPWERYRARNKALLSKLTEVYGACATVAREGDKIAGQLRFYPKAVWDMDGAGLLCLQQDHPAGTVDNFADRHFPPREELEDQTGLAQDVLLHRVTLTNLQPGPQRYYYVVASTDPTGNGPAESALAVTVPRPRWTWRLPASSSSPKWCWPATGRA